jgi:hypothetical protein
MTTIALFGAAGKMGSRISRRLRENKDYHTLYVESGEGGVARLRERGDTPAAPEQAVQRADVVILAIPDKLIGKASQSIVPQMNPHAMLVLLDPAAPWGGELPERKDITIFVCHPCHPPIVNDETDVEARMDFFGAVKAKQNVVAALMQGPEDDTSYFCSGDECLPRLCGADGDP